MPPVLADILAINGTILSPNDLTNSTAWFTWNSTYGGFASKAEATAAFHKFLQGVRHPCLTPQPRPLSISNWQLWRLCQGGSYSLLQQLLAWSDPPPPTPYPTLLNCETAPPN